MINLIRKCFTNLFIKYQLKKYYRNITTSIIRTYKAQFAIFTQ